MANYNCTIRTNYFHVKDEEKFRELMSRAYGSEDSIELWEREDTDGAVVFAFGLYGGIAGVRSSADEDDDDLSDTAYDEFIDGLQACVADDDAIIIFEAGNEKLRYVVGSAEIITSKGCEYLNIEAMAVQKAGLMLENPNWATACNY